MPKKFKRITYEKDNDDHYVVVLNPWANGFEKPRMQTQIDWIGAWLRIAFRKPVEKNIVKNIYTMDTRDEIIAKISLSVDIEMGLGVHRWRDFMEREHMDRIKQQTHGRIDLSDKVSHIFMYNWSSNGDPAERQWKEWFPRQDDIPQNIMVKMQYPDPEWSEIPPVDARLRSLLIPMPSMPDTSYNRTPNATPSRVTDSRERGPSFSDTNPLDQSHEQETKPGRGDVQAERHQGSPGDPSTAPRASDPATAFAPYQPPMHLQSRFIQPQSDQSSDDYGPALRPSKVDKLDPYEEDDALRAKLGPSPVKQEILDCVSHGSRAVKAEAEDIKPDVRDAEYRPSQALAAAITQLQDGEGSPEPEDRKPIIKNEDYTPTSALLGAMAQYSTISSHGADSTETPKRRLEESLDATVKVESSEPRTIKRIKVEATTSS